MARTLSPAPDAGPYEGDFTLGAERQAALLQARRFDELDLDNLIDEVEDLGRRERDAVASMGETIMEHLLELELSRADRPRRVRLVTIDRQRARLQRKLTTTLRNHLEAELPVVYAGRLRPLARQLEKDGMRAERCRRDAPIRSSRSYWYPDNLNGLRDPEP